MAKATSIPQPPTNARVIQEAVPEGSLDLDVNDAITGVLVGGARVSQKNGGKFRAIRTPEGDFWLGGTKLNQLGVMEMDPGTVLWIRRDEDVKTPNMPLPMKNYTVAVVTGPNSADE